MPRSLLDALSKSDCAAWSFAAAMLSLLLVWFGAMAFFPFGTPELVGLLGLEGDAVHVAAIAFGVVQLALGIAMLRPWPRQVRATAALFTALFWWSTLPFLFTPAAWVQAAPYDGFPFIGAGQGVLKHLGLGALGLGLWGRWSDRDSIKRGTLWAVWLGQLLVLSWIGAVKFTAYEAQGVEGLMRPSPFFSWLYGGLDVRGASNVIGTVELATLALVALWPWRPRLAAIGLCMAIATYLLTQTFLFTTPGWQAGYGAPFVGGTGRFLIKDLGLLAGAWLLLADAARRVVARRPGLQ